MSVSEYSDLLLPFGQLPDGRLVTPDVVERGAACGCACPQCEAPLVAKKGDVLRHHFAHAAEGCGMGALETALHKMAKQIIVDAGRLWLPQIAAVFNKGGFFRQEVIQKETWYSGEAVSEVRIGDVQPDVVITGEGRPVHVEIFVAHAVDAEKRKKLRAAELDTIEIDLARYPRSFAMGPLIDFVLQHAPRFWLCSLAHTQVMDRFDHEWQQFQHDLAEKWRRNREAEERRERAAREWREFHELREAEFERREEERRAVRPTTDSFFSETSAVIEQAPINRVPHPYPNDPWLSVGRMRPAGGNLVKPMAGAFCGRCCRQEFHPLEIGWSCSTCYPLETVA